MKINEENQIIEVPGDNSMHFYIKTEENFEQKKEKPFEIKLPSFSENEPEEPFKINLTSSSNIDKNDDENLIKPLKIDLFCENTKLPINNVEAMTQENTMINPQASNRKNSPDKKLGESSLNKCSSEKLFVNLMETKSDISPKSILRRANSAYNKRIIHKKNSQDDSILNYNENPLDYIFNKPSSLKKSDSEKVKEYEDLPSPKIKKIENLVNSSSSMPRRLSNSLSVTISGEAKDSGLSSFSIKPKSLNESFDSPSKKYKIVMLTKSLTSYFYFIYGFFLKYLFF